MQLSKLLLSLASTSLVSNVLAAPVDAELDKRAITVKLTTTVHQVTTNTDVVDAPTTTVTNTNIETSTSTVTSYTATITSTVFGTPHTYTTIATTPIIQGEKVAFEVNPTTTSSTSQPTTATPATTTSSTSSTSSTLVEITTTTPTPTPTAETPTSTVTASTADLSEETSSAPEVTSSPSTSADWIIEDVTTSVSNGVCVVSYDYYYASESDSYDETVTSTSTIFTTVTQA